MPKPICLKPLAVLAAVLAAMLAAVPAAAAPDASAAQAAPPAASGGHAGSHAGLRAGSHAASHAGPAAQQPGVSATATDSPAAFALQAAPAASRPAPAPWAPAGVRVLRDQPYGPEPRQRLDVYLPPDASGAAGPPTIFFMVHGGAWIAGSKSAPSLVRNKVRRWVSQGHILVVPNYRLVPRVTPREQADDVARAVAWARRHAHAWGGRPQRLVLMGHSAGAHLVALVAAELADDAAGDATGDAVGDAQADGPATAAVGGRLRAAPQPPARRWLGTVLLDGGALDVVQLMQAPHHAMYDLAFGRDPAAWAGFSPAARLAGPMPPVLAACNGARCAQARAYAQQAQRHGVSVEVLELPLSHGDFDTRLGEPGAYTDAVEAFLKRIGAL